MYSQTTGAALYKVTEGQEDGAEREVIIGKNPKDSKGRPLEWFQFFFVCVCVRLSGMMFKDSSVMDFIVRACVCVSSWVE